MKTADLSFVPLRRCADLDDAIKYDHRGLTYDDFRARAKDEELAPNEKIGFLNHSRAEAEAAIFADIVKKLPPLTQSERTIIDIGCGCGPLAEMLIAQCEKNDHQLIMVDSTEMLALLPQSTHVEKRAQRFPRDRSFLTEFHQAADAVLVYSVVQHELLDGDLWGMFDSVCSLLRDGGYALIGDVPNRSMRMRASKEPDIQRRLRDRLFPTQFDDSVIFSLLMRARNQGIDSYLMPQPAGLPFHMRREDIVLHRP